MFRILLLTVATAAFLGAQAMAEMGAAAAGGLAGATAGKAVSGGITAAMQKLDEAAKQGADGKTKEKGKEPAKQFTGPVLQVSPTATAASVSRGYSVPEPPPSRSLKVQRRATPVQESIPVAQVHLELPPAPTAPVIPAPTLASIEPGMEREIVARIQSPAIRITSFEEGHLVEVYRYKDGVVRMIDGSVQTVTRR